MTTLCASDLNLRSSDLEQANREAAGRACYRRAGVCGYTYAMQEKFKIRGMREWLPGETPQATARRIVPAYPDSVLRPDHGESAA